MAVALLRFPGFLLFCAHKTVSLKSFRGAIYGCKCHAFIFLVLGSCAHVHPTQGWCMACLRTLLASGSPASASTSLGTHRRKMHQMAAAAPGHPCNGSFCSECKFGCAVFAQHCLWEADKDQALFASPDISSVWCLRGLAPSSVATVNVAKLSGSPGWEE